MISEDTMELNGKRIVVVEDDYMLAVEVCRELRKFGATVLGPAPTPFYAMQLINGKRIDAAVLDVRLHGTTVFEVADRLTGQGVPIIFATGLNREELPGRYRNATCLEKPLDNTKLVAKIRELTREPARRALSAAPLPPVTPGRWAPVQSFARALAKRFPTG
jgi:DNA-binding response OmpR family regulator